MDKLIADGVINIRVTSITDEAHRDYAARVLAATRDAIADGISQGGELGYWQAKTAAAMEAGGLLGLYVNGGMPCGAAVIERSITLPGTAVLLAASSMWDRDTTERPLCQAALELAAQQGLLLSRANRVAHDLAPNETVTDINGNVLMTAARVVTTTFEPASGGGGGGPLEPV